MLLWWESRSPFAFLFVSSAFAQMNLFISREEMNRTLGVSAEMSYVTEGELNSYAAQFPYRVAPNVSHLGFTWNSHSPVGYSLSAVAEDFNVLPLLSIQGNGFVPTESQTFTVEYRCAGSRAGQFLVTLFFNFSFPSEEEPTVFTLKQEKICASKDGRRALAGNVEFDFNGNENTTGAPWLTMEHLAYLGVAALLFAVAMVMTAVCFYSRTNRKGVVTRYDGFTGTRNTTTANYPSKGAFDSTQPFLQPSTSTPKGASSITSRLLPDSSSSSTEPKIIFERKQNLDVNHSLVELYADRNLFQVLPFIELEGTFGEVRWAVWRQTAIGLSGDIDDEEDDVQEEIPVICKTLKHSTDRSHFEKFIREALVFHNVPQHLNLAQITAAATFGHFNNPESVKDFPLIAYRHTGFGFLKKFLQTCRGISDSAEEIPQRGGGPGRSAANQTLRAHDLISMSSQILKALIHLHRFGVIHKDVSTRNCLVAEVPALGLSDRLHVQLCDAALSRDVFPEDYYSPDGTDTVSRPVKWMAPEALRSNVFNSASDVWSFGVYMWELFTCGQQPYQEVPFEEIASTLASGTRLKQPYNCPDDVYSIMNSCWHPEVLERPRTEQLQRVIEDFGVQLRKYI